MTAITFFLHARPMMNGNAVQVDFYEGSHRGKAKNIPLGSVTFTRLQWEAFRPFIIAGIKLGRAPVEVLDGTRRSKPRTPKEVN